MHLENLPASPATNGEPDAVAISRPSRLPRWRHWSKRRTILTFGFVGLLCLGAVSGVLWWTGLLFGHAPFSGPTWTVKKEKLKVTIVARGSLESAKNGDIYCTVRSGTKGSTTATTIKWIIDAGTEVKKDEVLMILDFSGFQEQLKDKVKDVNSAYSLKVQADQQFEIQKLDNESDIKQKINALELAKIDLKKYIEGDFEQAKKDVDGRIETARSDLEDWKDRAAWSARMAKKGLTSKVQADADASRRDASQITLSKLFEEKRVLVDFIKPRTVQDLTAKLAEADLALRKANLQAGAKLKQAEADKQTKEFIYDQELSRKKEIEAEIEKCTVKSPQDGLVVYYVPEQVRGGGGSQQSIVAQGEPVREGQKMMQIPDLSRMIVNVRVPEALVSHLRNEEDPDDPKTWQVAQIKVDAFPNRLLKGHVRFVDTMASAQDFFAADVKIYKTLVAIDQRMAGLKPGMSAEVTISAEDSGNSVLVVPVQAVVGTISMGAERKCFVIGADGQPALRDIVVGMCNERLVEVKSGLSEGDRVILNPQPLLKDDSEMKAGKVRKSGDEYQGFGGDDGKGGGKKGAGKKKGAGPPPGLPGGPPNSPGGPNGPNGANAPAGTKGAGARLLPRDLPWVEPPALVFLRPAGIRSRLDERGA